MKNLLAAVAACMLMVGAAQAASPVNGGKLYNLHCVSCHGHNGQAQMPGVPDFKRRGLFKPNTQMVNLVERGSGVMPAYRGLLSREEILDVLAYIRSFY